MRPPFSRACLVSVTCLSATLSLAALPATALAMLVPVNHAERLNLRGAAASVIVGNAAILSVTIVDTHTVYVMGKGPGATNLTILDRAGQPIFNSEITVAGLGSNVTIYRGDKRAVANCSYGCAEASGDAASPQASMGAAGVGSAVASGLARSAGAARP